MTPLTPYNLKLVLMILYIIKAVLNYLKKKLNSTNKLIKVCYELLNKHDTVWMKK